MHTTKVFSGITRLLVGQASSKYCFHSSTIANKNVAVVLSGCGVYDGSELHETSAVLVHLSRAGAKAAMFAPPVDQMHVVNHLEGKPMEEKRNVLIESARIARGKVASLDSLKEKDFDAIIFPGGFGAAKNLSTFATDGPQMKLNADVERVLKDFIGARKPIGACCIAPVLVAKVLPGCEVTLGQEAEPAGQEGRWPYKDAAQAVTALGAKHINKNVVDIHVDNKNKIVTTPAFMCETDFHHIFDGIGKMVFGVMAFCK